MDKANFNFYGLGIKVQSKNQELVEEIVRDFKFFISGEAEADITVHIRLSPPRYEGLPDLPAQFITPRNVCYTDQGKVYIDYNGRALSIHDRPNRICTIESEDFDLAREIGYLFILSATGQYFDEAHLHRIHALGISREGKAAILLLPSGGGKSTMALRLLSRPGFRLLSDDSPLITKSGGVLGFPLRIGVSPDQESSIETQHVRVLKRMEFDPKTVIDIEAFSGKIARSASPRLLLVGQRNLGKISRIEPLSKPRAFQALINNMIVGLGLYQGLEFLLERGSWEVFMKAGLALSRLRNALSLLHQVECYRFISGRNLEQNFTCLLEFLDQKIPAARD